MQTLIIASSTNGAAPAEILAFIGSVTLALIVVGFLAEFAYGVYSGHPERVRTKNALIGAAFPSLILIAAALKDPSLLAHNAGIVVPSYILIFSLGAIARNRADVAKARETVAEFNKSA